MWAIEEIIFLLKRPFPESYVNFFKIQAFKISELRDFLQYSQGMWFLQLGYFDKAVL